jgi:hypothetical protein
MYAGSLIVMIQRLPGGSVTRVPACIGIAVESIHEPIHSMTGCGIVMYLPILSKTLLCDIGMGSVPCVQTIMRAVAIVECLYVLVLVC